MGDRPIIRLKHEPHPFPKKWDNELPDGLLSDSEDINFTLDSSGEWTESKTYTTVGSKVSLSGEVTSPDGYSWNIRKRMIFPRERAFPLMSPPISAPPNSISMFTRSTALRMPDYREPSRYRTENFSGTANGTDNYFRY